MPAATLELVAPAWHWCPPWDDTAGGEVADLCAAVGFAPDPEQRLILDAAFATARGGGVAVRDIGVVAPRQNLKTGVLKMMALGWLFLTEERLTVWSAHEFSTAQEAFRDMCVLLESHPDLDAQVKAVHRTSGGEAIELFGDRRLRFKARTKGGGRGLTGNRIILDEAMYLRADHMGALVPTLRAVRDPQLVYAGSAGLLDSVEWRRVRDRGRAGSDPSLAYVEWGDPGAWSGCAAEDCPHLVGSDGCALDDESRWWATNTALTAGRITVDSLRSDRKTLPPVEFARETLGWWEDPPPDGDDGDDVLADWPACADPSCAPVGAVALGVVLAHDKHGPAASIVACGAGADGRPTFEVVEYRSGPTTWVLGRLEELRARNTVTGVGVVAGSPAAALPGLPADVTILSGPEYAGGCQSLAQDVAAGMVRHRDERSLRISVDRAVRRFAGDGWRWSLKESRSDISPLVGAVVARWLWTTADVTDRSTAGLMTSFG